MIGTIGYLLVLCFVLVNFREAFGQTIPFNAVAESGGEVIFNCSRSSFRPNWYMSKDGTTTNQLPIAGSCVVSNGLENHYRTDPTGGPTVCNLVVFNVTVEQAGVYLCTDGVASYALLTILEKTPSVTYNTTENFAVENENVIITCTLVYSGSASPASTLRPYFDWTDLNGQRINGSYESTTESMALSQISVTAGRQNITPYTCHTYLQLNPTTIPNYASNTPVVSKRSISPTIEVLFSPSTPNISSWTESNSNCDFNVLSCNSSGNPPPKYKWFDANQSHSDVISEEQNVSYAEVNHNYICEAYNTIRNVMHTNSTNHVVVIPGNSTNNSYCETNPDVTDNHLLRTILLAAILGGYGLLNIIATIAFLVYYSRKSNKAKLNARFSWLQNMLPCMNEIRGNVGCKFISVILFLVMSLLAGIIVFPILVAVANCSRRSSISIGNSDIAMGDAASVNDISPNSKAAGSPSTAAHGDVDAHYDVIRNTKHLADYYNDAPSDGTKKLVPYTCVQTNGNTTDDVDRYYVSLPDTIAKS